MVLDFHEAPAFGRRRAIEYDVHETFLHFVSST
jgi:hypothetical protein